MSSKNKVYLSIGALCLVAVVAIVSIVAVFAARSQAFKTTIKVTYTAHEIDGTVAANWIFNGTSHAMTTDGQPAGDTNKTLDFKGGAGQTEGTLSPISTESEIELTSTVQFVVFEYIFTNRASKAYTAVLSYQDTDENDQNILVYATTGKEGSIASPTWESEGMETKSTSGEITTATVPANANNYCVYIAVKIESLTVDATFSGAFSWNLTSE